MNEPAEIPSSWNLPFVERLYAVFARDPQSLDPRWKKYFQQLQNGEPVAAPRFGPSFEPAGLFHPRPAAPPAGQGLDEVSLARLQNRVNQLVRNYRVRGHNIAALDPLGLPRPVPPELELDFFGFSESDLDRPIHCQTLQCPGPLTIRQIIEHLRDTYCRSIGVQYMHIDNFAIRRWLQERMEGTRNRLKLTRDEQIRIFTRLTDAVAFEEFIRRKFVGAKSFSLEGCESLIPLLDLAIEKAAEQGTKEIVLGMAHRGRLNVLANIIGKSPRQIFREFADDPKLMVGQGDVKYHLGYSNDWLASSGRRIHLSLCFNPSHLEFVNPVVLGRARAKMDRAAAADRDRAGRPAPPLTPRFQPQSRPNWLDSASDGAPSGSGCMALLIHGDASFAGQGLVQETLNLSQLPGYTVGGALHVVVNNQIGFTTPPSEARSSAYPTDVAKMLQIPIFHVNGEDPEAVAQVVRLAMDFRQTFHRDVVIDMFGYRRLGHNEGDEPSFTQPVLYRAIEQRKSVREGYLDHLLALGELRRQEADEIARRRYESLEQELSRAQTEPASPPAEKILGVWSRGHYTGGAEKNARDAATGVSQERLSQLLERQTQLPEGFHPHPKIKKLLAARRRMARGEEPLDWSAAEALAFASLSAEGFRVRLSGQDSARGTFSQRHAVLYDYENGEPYVPLKHLAPGQAPVDVINSPLSEAGVLGFDYGYSLDCPDGLIAWEAQFGDFINSAQVIVDQFIASAEAKWNRLSGLVLLLPHGFEGQGPEHSSARLERFLALGAQDNIQVVYPTTPAQYFHCLRRQVVRNWRKPLVVMTPKSLLRHPDAGSTLQQCAEGKFECVLADSLPDAGKVRRILLCAGKIFYELESRRMELGRQDVAILRVEQLYPLHEEALRLALAAYGEGTPVLWVQEEPENMGAWRYLRARFGERLFGFPFGGLRRPASASPATGSARVHKRDQAYLVAQAFPQA
jgi:2-oxoglutarate dehydrogenase E1 component